MHKSKRYKKLEEVLEKKKLYSFPEAVAIIKKTSTAKFDESIDLALNLGVNPKYSDQMVRSTVVLPHGTGQSRKVVVLTNEESKEQEAKKAGADFIGFEDIIEKIKGGWFDFDVIVVTPGVMKDISKLGKVLGPKGLMPSPKAGTVTNDIEKAVKEIKKGKVEFKVDKTANLHMNVGKVSFTEDKIAENIAAAVLAVVKARPTAAKGQYIKSCTLSSTMGVGIKLDTKESAFAGTI